MKLSFGFIFLLWNWMLSADSHLLEATSLELRHGPAQIPLPDVNGYIIFCLCMGRLGNQLEHLLGGMAFAKELNRTLIIPPFRTYKNVMFTEWFKLTPMLSYHKSILAEDFMEHLAPAVWLIDQRTAFCVSNEETCLMTGDDRFSPFWKELGIHFTADKPVQFGYQSPLLWKKKFPANEYPVIALRGAPASFPVHAEHRQFQQYLEFSDQISDEADDFINKNFPNKQFVGIHLRNGNDWKKACENVNGRQSYMASPQCLDNTKQTVTTVLCYPDDQEIYRSLKQVIETTNIDVVFVATDKRPMKYEIENYFKKRQVEVFHADPHLPIIDLAILVKADHFIGNCVSSFTSFVKRYRDVLKKSTLFFGFDN